MRKPAVAAFIIAAAAVAVTACTAPEPAGAPARRMSELPPPPAPADNPITAEKAALGKLLFHDKRLSGNGQMACQSCHYHHLGWADATRFSAMHNGNLNTRHTPTIYNVAYQTSWYWDGRAATLEANNLAAWRNQMGGDPARVAASLNAIPAYREAFQKAFGAPASQDTIVKALATYFRTLNTGESAWDRHEMGRANAVSRDAREGFDLFAGKGRCIVCHTPPFYTNNEHYNIGLEAGKAKPDPGRFNVTRRVEDTGAFKTPTLRAVARSAPYFHDASAATLEEAVRYMAGGGRADPHKTPLMIPTGLTDAEIRKIVAFLEALTGNDTYEAPRLP
ncbi:MAG: c-type cytochrome [Burkholderiales bacterium]|nr:c-type cytochrome [Burkholderiales bacterium]